MPSKPGDDKVSYLEALCAAVPFHLVQAVLKHPVEESVQGQEVDGSILHARIIGVSSICERLAAKGAKALGKLGELLNSVYRPLLEEAIVPFGGYALQLNGDSMTVMFRGDDHCLRATAAALTAQHLMCGETGRIAGGEFRELMFRVGVARGKAQLVIVGEMARRMLVPAGEAVHAAVQLQRRANANTVVIGAEIAEELGDVVEAAEHGHGFVVVRGLRIYPPRGKSRRVGADLRDGVDAKIALLEPFVPPTLAAWLRGCKPGVDLPGELRRAVIVTADVRGSGATIQDRHIAQEVTRALLRTIRKHGGVVCGISPTAVGQRGTIAFGLEEANDNDSERAIVAALEAVSRAKTLVGGDIEEFGVRMGVHRGLVYVGAIGSPSRYQQLIVVGDGTTLSVQCARAAPAFSVICTSTVLQGIESHFVCSDRGMLMPKGAAESITIHHAHAPRENEARFVQAGEKTDLEDVRPADTDVLVAAVDAAARGKPQIVGICGDAGSGKSDLAARLMHHWTKNGGSCVIGRCSYATKSVPLAPIVRMFENFFAIDTDTSSAERRAKIREGLRGLGFESVVPELVSILQPARRPDGTTATLLDPTDPHVHERILASISQWVVLRARATPIMFVVEDLHYADSLTLRLAMRLTALSGRVPLVLIGTYRPDPVLSDLRRALGDEVELRRLTVNQVAQLLKQVWGGRLVGRELAQLVSERSNGLPGLVLELARVLEERNLLERDDNAVRLVQTGRDAAEAIVPDVVATMMQAKLASASPGERRVLAVASILGQDADRKLIEAALASKMAEPLVEVSLTTLGEKRLLVATERGTLSFCDPATRAVVLAALPEAERMAYHRRIADALEPLVLKDRSDLEAALGRHRASAGDYGEALRWLERAARAALETGLYREADELAEEWRRAAKRLPMETRPSPKRWARVAVLKLAAAAHRGAPRHTLRLAKIIRERFGSLLGDKGSIIVDYWVGDALLRVGDANEARQRLQAVFAMAEQTGNSKMACDAGRLLASSYKHACELSAGHTWLDRAEVHVGEDTHARVRLDLVRGSLKIDEAEYAAARAVFTRCQEVAEEHNFLQLAASAITNTAYLDLITCRFSSARKGFERAIVIDRAVGSWADEATDLVNLGQTLLWASSPDAGRFYLERALARARVLDEQLIAAEAQVHLGLALALTEDLAHGQSVCEEGVEFATKAGLQEVVIAGWLHLLRIGVLRGSAAVVDRYLKLLDADRTYMTTPLFQEAFSALEREAAPLLEMYA
ncbi:MAG: hypothetical protein A2341_08495 [Deltaproteobacteria bacterium RIFOXYB12_FULL_58_9]|nr:MAG: hypothetical protein A2341_08495 [Deltaproteobacteria bacterium RIFOXYB12_FULL_58_9]